MKAAVPRADNQWVRRMRVVSVGLTLAVVAGAVAGCSGPEHRASADEAGGDASPILRIGVVADVSPDPVTLDPTDSVDVAVSDLLYDGLTAVDDDAAVVPALAASWSTGDGVTWRFDLDAERGFSDGSTVDADAVVASLTSVVAHRDGNLAAAALDVIDGAAELGRGEAPVVRGLRAVDSHTVEIVLTAPNHELPALLADPAYGIVAPTGGRTLTPSLVSSGPYAVDRASGASSPGTSTRLRPVDPGSDRPSVELVRVADPEAAVAALRSGRVDVAPLGNVLKAPAGSTETFVSAARLALEVHVPLGHLAGPKARGALSATIDRVAAVQAATRHDRAPVWGVAPFGSACDEGCVGASDPAELAALATAGPLRLDVPQGGLTERLGAELARQLAEAGITLEVRVVDADGLAGDLAAGSVDLSLFAVVSRAPTPDPVLAAVFGSAGVENVSGASPDGFDAGLAAARATDDDDARRSAYEALERSATSDGAVVPLVALGERFAVRGGAPGVDLLAGW